MSEPEPSQSSISAPSSEIRKHYYLNRFVVIAPKRNLRPDAFKGDAGHKTETETSPAIENDPAVFEIKDTNGNWLVKVVENLYPALSNDNPKAYGKHQIIIETPEHNREFSELDTAQILRVFQAYTDRLQVLSQLDDIKYVSVFKNDGPKAGASIAHAHSQVIAWPLIPPEVSSEAQVIVSYSRAHSTCPHCDVIKWEQGQKERIIFEDDHVIAVSPYATRVAFGAWIMPKIHRSNFGDLSTDELRSMAEILKKMTTKLDEHVISFNFFLQNSAPGYEHHFVLRLDPRVNTWAGGELSTGIIINPVSPEYAARWYRDEVK